MAPNDPHPASAITSVTGSTILNAIDQSSCGELRRIDPRVRGKSGAM
jgi:hypothetical protein